MRSQVARAVARHAPLDGAALATNVVQFGRMLRRAGLDVDAAQTRLFADVLVRLGVGRRADVKSAGRTVFVRRREERATYDAAFDLFWRRATVVGGTSAALPRLRQKELPRHDVNFGPQAAPGVVATDVERTSRAQSASLDARVRTADFADLTPSETRDAFAMLSALRPRLPLRASRRRVLERSGERLATRRMARRSLGAGG